MRIEQQPAAATQALSMPSATESQTAPSGMPDTGSALAALFIQEGYLTADQLAYARKVQSKLATPATLLQVLQELRFITPDQLRQTLRMNHLSVRLGDLLVELGLLRTVDLEAALAIQKGTQPKKKLGEILVEGHFIEARRLAEILAFQLGFIYVEPHFADLDQDLLAQGPMKSYVEYLFLPVARQDNHVVVAFADPLDKRATDVAEGIFGRNLVVAIATKPSIQEALALLARSTNQPKVSNTNDNTVVGIVNALFEAAAQEKASDIHIEPMQDCLRVRLRCDGLQEKYRC